MLCFLSLTADRNLGHGIQKLITFLLAHELEMLNENTDRAKKKKKRKKDELKIGSMCPSPQETHVPLTTLFSHFAKFLSVWEKPHKSQEIKEEMRKNEA